MMNFGWVSLMRRVVAVAALVGMESGLAWGQRFAVVGDYGSASLGERDVARLIAGWNPEFILTMGDNNYERGSAATIDANIGQFYHQYILNYQGRYGAGSATQRFYPCLGNHDLYTGAGKPYLDYFTLPGNERYYDFVQGNVHFFALNSDNSEPDGNTSTSAQAQWLKDKLAQAREPWKVVYLHHAPYSSGPHGSTTALQWPFREWGASVVLAGHDHQYERLEIDGLTYLVNGLGGHSRYATPVAVPGSQTRFSGDYGAMRVLATPDSLQFEFITRGQQLIERYALGRPVQIGLLSVLPNPFSEAARVQVELPVAAAVLVRVLDSKGQEVARLQEGELPAGRHTIGWERGSLASGIYYIQLQAGSQSRAVAVQVE